MWDPETSLTLWWEATPSEGEKQLPCVRFFKKWGFSAPRGTFCYILQKKILLLPKYNAIVIAVASRDRTRSSLGSQSADSP